MYLVNGGSFFNLKKYLDAIAVTLITDQISAQSVEWYFTLLYTRELEPCAFQIHNVEMNQDFALEHFS